jgi:hypothetical protein
VEREEDDTYWWVLFGACEEVARGKLTGKVETARRLAREIDRRMPAELRRSFMEDADGAVFEPVFYDHPIHYLVPLTPPQRENWGTERGNGERGNRKHVIPTSVATRDPSKSARTHRDPSLRSG